jgi:serine/threonine protein kinase
LAKDYYRTFIFDPKNGGASVDDDVICFDVDEEKIDIGYLVYQMNEGYFLEQLFPHKGENVYPINSTDILACQILVPDVESSVERQKQIIEDLRQKEIAEIARRYGFDLGKFVQYKASDLLKGTTLNKGKYTVEGVIGHGGFGKVYKARNEETGEVVAIKEFFYHSRQVRDPETNNVRTNFADIGYVDDAKDKFRREKAKIQECAHDNIVKVYEEFEENNTCYYAMEYIDGENLVNKKGIGEREALAIIRQVAEALKTMHKKRYNHSDVKPQNILLDSNGVATLIDFSGAHHYGDDEKEGLSITGNSIPMEIKTPGYTPDCAYKAKGFPCRQGYILIGSDIVLYAYR